MRHVINCLHPVIEFDRSADVLEALGEITSGWTLSPSARAPDIVVARKGTAYELASTHRSGLIIEETAVSAACSLIVDVAEIHASLHPDMLCLHAGAVRIGESLVVFPSGRRAGKSTLAAYLTSLGAELFADDILPVCLRDGEYEACAFGVTSRLRLPLPPELPSAFLARCDALAGPQDAYYRYLKPETGLAPFGVRAPVRAIVFLERHAGSEPDCLRQVPRGDAIKHILVRNFGRSAPAGDILRSVEQFAASCRSYSLAYGRLEAAAQILFETFGSDADVPEPVHVHRPAGRISHQQRDGFPVSSTSGTFVRAGTCQLRRIDGATFVVDAERSCIFALEGLGLATWELLAEPIHSDDVICALSDVYPHIDANRIEQDVRRFLDALVNRSLAHCVSPKELVGSRFDLGSIGPV